MEANDVAKSAPKRKYVTDQALEEARKELRTLAETSKIKVLGSWFRKQKKEMDNVPRGAKYSIRHTDLPAAINQVEQYRRNEININQLSPLAKRMVDAEEFQNDTEMQAELEKTSLLAYNVSRNYLEGMKQGLSHWANGLPTHVNHMTALFSPLEGKTGSTLSADAMSILQKHIEQLRQIAKSKQGGSIDLSSTEALSLVKTFSALTKTQDGSSSTAQGEQPSKRLRKRLRPMTEEGPTSDIFPTQIQQTSDPLEVCSGLPPEQMLPDTSLWDSGSTVWTEQGTLPGFTKGTDETEEQFMQRIMEAMF
ncbi:hypothetical protein QFC21_002674 [Naganishia friedmannii]|uniref:Uncharacterized protein n=1 Tax=Naganishia friedmannii TaxID=89922 RepID=A0ACC2VVV1_9TREE|nr:hypothetical protein QFC21_002674 [Naganishia friedmannii]